MQPGISFLGVGAQKCGTTWLHDMVAKHPDVSVPTTKEIDFFISRENYARGLGWYLEHFPDRVEKRAVGEFDPNYWWTEFDPAEDPDYEMNQGVPGLIRQHFPDVRLIVSLRNPVRRAISAFHHHLRAGRLPLRSRISQCVHRYGIVSMGHYDVHLGNYLDLFSSEQVLVLIYEEDLAPDSYGDTLRRVFRHIGVDPTFDPGRLGRRANVRSRAFDIRTSRLPEPARRLVRKLVPETLKDASFWSFRISESEIRWLKDHFAPHNQALSEMLGRTLPW